MPGHKTCKQDAIKTLMDISFKLQHLKDMTHDECPLLKGITVDDLQFIDCEITSIRQIISQNKENRHGN